MWHLLSFVCLQFLETGPELGSHYNEVIAPQDVATYGGLCALASFDRTELKVSVLFLLFSLFFTIITVFHWHNESPRAISD
jgi:hypothetical protein